MIGWTTDIRGGVVVVGGGLGGEVGVVTIATFSGVGSRMAKGRRGAVPATRTASPTATSARGRPSSE